MKLQEILEHEQLDEVSLKGALAAGMLGAASLGAVNPMHQDKPPVVQPQKPRPELKEIQPKHDFMFNRKEQALVDRVVDKYDIDENLAKRIVFYAHKYESPVWPKAQDILSIVGIESSFDPEAVSALKRDPARGLMQVRPQVWNIDPDDLKDIESQIKHGSQILQWYFKKLRNREAAVQAYNVGLTDYNQGVGAPEYLQKFHNERQLYAGI